jgi:hypothetical protein
MDDRGLAGHGGFAIARRFVGDPEAARGYALLRHGSLLAGERDALRAYQHSGLDGDADRCSPAGRIMQLWTFEDLADAAA